MNFLINPLSYKDVFTLPTEVVNRLKFAGADQLRFILYVYSSKDSEFSLDNIAKTLKISKESAEECLLFWQDTGLIISNDVGFKEIPKKKEVKTKSVQKIDTPEKPTRNDALKRLSENEMLRLAMVEIEKKLCRTTGSNERISFVWMHDSLGLPIEVILTLVEYCVSEQKTGIRYMEKLANEWALKDIDTLDKAEDMLKNRAMSQKAWSKVARVFGIQSRKPSDKELVFSNRWVNEWGFSTAMLKCAYNTCIDSKTKLSFAYVNSILNSWHEKGFKKPEDITNKVPASNKPGLNSSIDIDEFSTALLNRKIRKEN